jgi:antitoxin (DNA-binding transcriptional repressor) of toxin-antitoxin stability system
VTMPRAYWDTGGSLPQPERTGAMHDELPIEDVAALAGAVHEAASGQVVYITEHGERVAAIVPPGMVAVLERLSADVLEELSVTAARGGSDDLAELLEELSDRAAAREARARIAAGSPLIPWEQVKAKAGL